MQIKKNRFIPALLVSLATGLVPLRAFASDQGHCTTMNVPVTVAGVSDASIFGELCVPAGPTPAAVQLLVHTTWYNHKYWDPPMEQYSYSRTAVGQGYATFNIDRLGTGRSTKPAPELVTIEAVEDTLHQIIAGLRSGSIGGKPFSKVVWVGASFGAAYGWVNATRHPGDIDAYILTAIMHYTKPSFVVKGLTLTNGACDDPIFSHQDIDCGYFSSTIGQAGALYYYEPGAAPGMLGGVNDFVLRDVVRSTWRPRAWRGSAES
jgi:pimeloyl-ACP methyl ester carboxylesterase